LPAATMNTGRQITKLPYSGYDFQPSYLQSYLQYRDKIFTMRCSWKTTPATIWLSPRGMLVP